MLVSLGRRKRRRIVRRLLRDPDVVRMALPKSGASDLHELRLLSQLLQRGRPDVTHPRSETADELSHRFGQGTLKGNAPFDALRHHYSAFFDLEIPIRRALLHRADRAHSSVHLIGTVP